ncbi:DUF6082 family protein [Streptomyces sp. NPDC046860]|uniref:DUF6082 family protein n=1 Tax=Streptomyces sp. NPDC046860 TaxID=3154495 RepID=UPI0033DA4C2B
MPIRTPHVLLLLAAVGVTRLVQSERHQHQRNHIALTALHTDWLGVLVDNPELAEAWAPEGADIEQWKRHLHLNRQLCGLALRHRLGAIGGAGLRFVADSVMEREVGRSYWKTYGTFRQKEAAGDPAAMAFHTALQDAYVAACPDTEPTGY